MQVDFVDLKRQYYVIEKEVLTEITKVLGSMKLFLGYNVQQFEEDFARYCGTEFAIGVGSGTEALHLALLASGIQERDEVITVPNTFIATVEAITLAGAMPIFVDIDPNTYNIDVTQIENRITSNTKAIIPVHLYGHPADMEPIRELALSYNLTVIEDACQAHGAEYMGRRTGSLGDIGCFSFYFTKNLGAYGEAGMIVTSDPYIARKCKMLRDHGQENKYSHTLMGVNSRLDEIQAAVLRVKLPHLEEWNNKRRAIAQAYEKGLPSSLVKPIEMPWAKHVYHLYVVRSRYRDQIRNYLHSKGIATGMHYPIPIHLQEAYQAYYNYNNKDSSFPVTERLTKQILSLPMFPELTPQEVEYVCSCIREFSESCTEADRIGVQGGS
jgi:dTDP-4-amino-4,6-dideoxygalactose transaminase